MNIIIVFVTNNTVAKFRHMVSQYSIIIMQGAKIMCVLTKTPPS